MDLKEKEHFISLGKGEKGKERIKTASIIVQLFRPMDNQKEVTIQEIDQAYQDVLDDLGKVLDNLTEADWRALQIVLTIGKRLKRDKKIDPSEIMSLLTELQKMNIINIDRPAELNMEGE